VTLFACRIINKIIPGCCPERVIIISSSSSSSSSSTTTTTTTTANGSTPTSLSRSRSKGSLKVDVTSLPATPADATPLLYAETMLSGCGAAVTCDV
jgi:hypothetical protein